MICRGSLVPKPELGNSVWEAPASRLAKLERFTSWSMGTSVFVT